MQARSVEFRIDQVDAAQVDAAQVGVAPVGAPEVRVREIRAAQVETPKAGVLELRGVFCGAFVKLVELALDE